MYMAHHWFACDWIPDTVWLSWACVPPSCLSSTRRPSCWTPARATSWRRPTHATTWASPRRRTRPSWSTTRRLAPGRPMHPSRPPRHPHLLHRLRRLPPRPLPPPPHVSPRSWPFKGPALHPLALPTLSVSVVVVCPQPTPTTLQKSDLLPIQMRNVSYVGVFWTSLNWIKNSSHLSTIKSTFSAIWIFLLLNWFHCFSAHLSVFSNFYQSLSIMVMLVCLLADHNFIKT